LEARNELASVATLVIAIAQSSLDSAIAATDPSEKDRFVNEAKVQLSTLAAAGKKAAREVQAEVGISEDSVM
jgi:hypothetical protein